MTRHAMTRPAPERRDRDAAGTPRRRPLGRPRTAAAGLTVVLAAALAIPALTFAGGTAVAAASAGSAAYHGKADRAGPARPAAAGIAAAGTAGGPLQAWGSNQTGQLGDGTTNATAVPVKVQLPSGTTVTQARGGCFHTVALTSKGHVLAWGDNSFGQLGNGTTISSDAPVRVQLPSGTKVTAVRAGCLFSLALTSKGHVLAWGDNTDGQFGNGTTADSDTPVRVKLPQGSTATAISAGENFGLARTAKDHALAWGDNSFGQLGNDTTISSKTPVRVKLPKGSKVRILSAGFNFAFASTSGGGAYAWGADNVGQLGDGITTTDSDTPVSIGPQQVGSQQVGSQQGGSRQGGPFGHLVSVVAGCGHALALISTGQLLAWGANSMGQLGNGTTTSSDKGVLVMLPAGTTVTAISAGCEDSYALTANGQVLAWGANSKSQLGDDGDLTSRDTPVMVDLPSGQRPLVVGAGPLASSAFAVMHE
jgi:alpha-tubulin suppressor-like RCC1 family protein